MTKNKPLKEKAKFILFLSDLFPSIFSNYLTTKLFFAVVSSFSKSVMVCIVEHIWSLQQHNKKLKSFLYPYGLFHITSYLKPDQNYLVVWNWDTYKALSDVQW